MEQQIDEPGAVAAEQLGVKLLLPHPDAGERGHGREQWIENARAHALGPASGNRIVARREPAGNPHASRHGRGCPGHPGLDADGLSKTWMLGTRPGMTTER